MSAPLVVNTTDGTCWTQRKATRDGEPLYALADCVRCPELVMATYAELAEHGTAGSADALPVPVGPERLTSAEREMVLGLIEDAKPASSGLLLSFAESVRNRREHEHPQWEDFYCLNLSSYMGERSGPVLRRLVDVEAENERLRARVAELEAAPTIVYRAEHPDSGITLGHYSSIDAARQHCVTLASREGNTGIVSWVPDDSDPWSPEELTFFDVEYCDGDDVPVQTCTGYVVTPLEAPSEYDEEADE